MSSATPGATPSGFDPTAAVLPGGIGLAPSFPVASRYAALPLATVEVDGEPVRYVTRRFLPQPERFAAIEEHVVTAGQRVDTIAAELVGDPEQFWRVCDANNALHPSEITEVGRRLRVTLPEGMAGPAE